MPRLGQYLKAQRLLTDEQLEEALGHQAVCGARLGTNLVELRMISLEQLAESLSNFHRIPLPPRPWLERPQRAALQRVTRPLVETRRFIPMRLDAKMLHAAVMDPLDPGLIDDLRFATGCRIEPYVLPEIWMHDWLLSLFDIPRGIRLIEVRMPEAEEPPDDFAAYGAIALDDAVPVPAAAPPARPASPPPAGRASPPPARPRPAPSARPQSPLPARPPPPRRAVAASVPSAPPPVPAAAISVPAAPPPVPAATPPRHAETAMRWPPVPAHVATAPPPAAPVPVSSAAESPTATESQAAPVESDVASPPAPAAPVPAPVPAPADLDQHPSSDGESVRPPPIAVRSLEDLSGTLEAQGTAAAAPAVVTIEAATSAFWDKAPRAAELSLPEGDTEVDSQSAPSQRAEPAALEQVVSADELRELERALSVAPDRDHVIELVFAIAGCFANTGALFMVQQGMVQGMQCVKRGEPREIDGVLVPLGSESLLTEAAASGKPMRGDPTERALDERLIALLDDEGAREVGVFPIAIGKRVINVLYASNGAEGLGAIAFAGLAACAAQMGAAYARLIRSRKAAGS